MAGALAGQLASGGGASINPSSSATSGPLAGTTGSLILNFGGINLGSQDIPLTQSDNESTNQPATVGNTPLSALTGINPQSMNPTMLLLIAGVIAVALVLSKHH